MLIFSKIVVLIDAAYKCFSTIGLSCEFGFKGFQKKNLDDAKNDRGDKVTVECKSEWVKQKAFSATKNVQF